MSIQAFLESILIFLNSVIVPALLALAFVIFLINAVRYFIFGATNQETQVKAKSLAMWSIAAFVIIVSLWGIVNLFARGFGLNTPGSIIPDYMCNKLGGNCRAPANQNSQPPF